MWESVFWNDDNYRPDKTTKTWSELYSKKDSEVQRKMSIAFSDLKLSGSADVLGIAKGSFSAKTNIDFSFQYLHVKRRN